LIIDHNGSELGRASIVQVRLSRGDGHSQFARTAAALRAGLARARGSHERSHHRPLSPQRSANAVKTALNLYFQSRARAARVLALSIVIWSIPTVGSASEALEQKFDGVVVPRQWVQVVPQVNGVVSRILFVPGQRVSKGDVLFEMDPAQLDPMEVYFRVPYVERQRAFDKAGTSDADDVFDRSTLTLELPSERTYELSGKPEPHGEEIDQSTDVMTVWALFPNPHNILVPGLKVHVISRLADQTR
jgi:hypothetical protein